MKKFVIFPSNTLESGRAFGEMTMSKELFKIGCREAKGRNSNVEKPTVLMVRESSGE